MFNTLYLKYLDGLLICSNVTFMHSICRVPLTLIVISLKYIWSFDVLVKGIAALQSLFTKLRYMLITAVNSKIYFTACHHFTPSHHFTPRHHLTPRHHFTLRHHFTPRHHLTPRHHFTLRHHFTTLSFFTPNVFTCKINIIICQGNLWSIRVYCYNFS